MIKSQPSFHFCAISLPASVIGFLHFISRTTHALGFPLSYRPSIFIYPSSFNYLPSLLQCSPPVQWLGYYTQMDIPAQTFLDLQTPIGNCPLHHISIWMFVDTQNLTYPKLHSLFHSQSSQSQLMATPDCQFPPESITLACKCSSPIYPYGLLAHLP